MEERKSRERGGKEIGLLYDKGQNEGNTGEGRGNNKEEERKGGRKGKRKEGWKGKKDRKEKEVKEKEEKKRIEREWMGKKKEGKKTLSH